MNPTAPVQQTPAPQPQSVCEMRVPLKHWSAFPLMRLLQHKTVAPVQVNKVYKSLLPAT